MKFSEHWLREWVNPALDTERFAAQLTMAGLEVDALEPVAPPFAGVVVGEISALQPHGEHLHMCQVDVGDTEPLTVICGAPNVRIGMRAPLAIVGAQLPGKLISQTTIHGVESQGMLCSAAELGLAEHADGLLELPADTRIGEDVYAYMQLDDFTVELGLTPNRGDCLSIAGIAREVAALNRCAVNGTPAVPVAASIPDSLDIVVEQPAHCPRYLGRVVTGIRTDATTPLWMAERLRRSGIRCISPVVDITNHVMLELGQPMHAFDLAKLDGGICVRLAHADESISLLDGQTIRLNEDTLVIADDHQAHAMAGIMGGVAASISASSESLFLESAFFAPLPIAGRARHYGLHTDSSFRFERGVDPRLPRLALERATALLLEIVGGQAGPIIEVTSSAHLPVRVPVKLRATALQRLLGISIPDVEVAGMLTRLGMSISTLDDGWQVTPPSHRFDIAIEADLIEEVARVFGYENLPVTRPMMRLSMSPHSETRVDTGQLREVLVGRGYQEIISFSFVDPTLQNMLTPQHPPVAVANPISQDMSVMRTSLWCGLIQALLHNQKRQQTRLRFFETGVNFIRQDGELRQDTYLAGIAGADLDPEQWGLPARAVIFFDMKADVESLTELGGDAAAFSYHAASHPALHPGQSAQIRHEGQVAGWIGALHPAIMRKLDIGQRVFLFEITLSALAARTIPRGHELSRFPAIRRDIAVVVDVNVCAQAVLDCIIETACDITLRARLFDVYQGKGVDLGRKSLALGLTLQSPSRTLTDTDAEAVVDQIVQRLNHNFGAVLRT